MPSLLLLIVLVAGRIRCRYTYGWIIGRKTRWSVVGRTAPVLPDGFLETCADSEEHIAFEVQVGQPQFPFSVQRYQKFECAERA